jgi:hypothetical protein
MMSRSTFARNVKKKSSCTPRAANDRMIEDAVSAGTPRAMRSVSTAKGTVSGCLGRDDRSLKSSDWVAPA